MKKLCATLIFALAWLLPFGMSADNSFVIDGFKSDLVIQPDGRVKVTETIVVDFIGAHHGIFRDIPVAYRNADGSTHYTSIDNISVSDGSNPVRYALSRNVSNLRLQIGDPNIQVSGRQTYVIAYTATGVLAAFADHDELYWNVNGMGWEVVTNSVQATVRIEGTSLTGLQCYIGSVGSTDACTASLGSDGTAIFSSSAPLAPGQGMTIAAAYGQGIIPVLSVAPPPAPPSFSFPYVAFGFLLILLLASLATGWLWWVKGRDAYYERKSLHDPEQTERIRPLFGAAESIVPEYDPPAGLRPAELGVLLDEQADMVDISASIVDLAVRGYLTISETKKSGFFGGSDYTLTKIEKETGELLAYEATLLEELFVGGQTVKISDLKEKFHTAISKVKELLYASVTDKKIFYANPKKVRQKYEIIGISAIALSFFLLFVFMGNMSIALAKSEAFFSLLFGLNAGLFAAGIMLSLMARAMPKRTAYGRELYRQALGYKLFVSGTEKYRQPFFERENIFMEVLPYAMVFGVTAKLAKAMQEMQLAPNTAGWYTGPGTFNMIAFAGSMNNFSGALSNTMASAPGGSGFSGGSAGGGFGGGGGGGW